MSVSAPWFRVGGTLVVCMAMGSGAMAQEGLVVDHYVEIVLRAHPSTAQSAGIELAAGPEGKAARLFPDPVFEYSRDRATAAGLPGPQATETGYSVSQAIPWPGTFSAGIRAADRAADALRAGAEGLRWELAAQARQAFARLAAARVLLDVARGAEDDARSLRDLVTRRAELGESRESDRIKATLGERAQDGLGGFSLPPGHREVALLAEPLAKPQCGRERARAPAGSRRRGGSQLRSLSSAAPLSSRVHGERRHRGQADPESVEV